MFKFQSRRLYRTPYLKTGFSNRFASTLTFLETTPNGDFTSSSLSVLTAARELGNPIIGVVLNSNLKHDQVKSLPIINKLLFSNNTMFKDNLPEVITPLLSDLIKKKRVSHFLIANNILGKNILPRLGAILDIQPISNVIKIDNDKNTFYRPIYAGNIISQIEAKQPIKLLSIGTSLFPEYSMTNEESTTSNNIEELSLLKDDIEYVVPNVINQENSNVDENKLPELTSARVIIAGGAGLKNKENFNNLLYPLAQKFDHAAIGATRVAVDNGYCPNSIQVGQTGKIVSPDLYIAIGISGAIQHLAGMKDSKVIVAINKDLDAPICKIADYSIQGDLFEIVPELINKL